MRKGKRLRHWARLPLRHAILILLFVVTPALGQEDNGSRVYIGPAPDWLEAETAPSTPMLMLDADARDPDGQLYSLLPGSSIPLPRDPDGSCTSDDTLAIGLMGPLDVHLSSTKQKIRVEVDPDACVLHVLTNKYYKKPTFAEPPAAVTQHAPRDTEHPRYHVRRIKWLGRVKQHLKRITRATGYQSSISRAKVYAGLRWWDNFVSVYNGHREYSLISSRTDIGWFVQVFNTYWNTTGPSFVDAYAFACVRNANVGTACAESYMVGRPGGTFQPQCWRRGATTAKYLYRWDCNSYKKDLVQEIF
jgi:hypothetical protein